MMTTHTDSHADSTKTPHACPWWLGPLLTIPLRRLIDPPNRLVAPFVGPGMTVVEPGCGMGYFTLPAARLVGETGLVYAADVQPQMLAGLTRRARRARLESRIRPVSCGPDDVGLASLQGVADVALVIYMLHEVPDQRSMLAQLFATLKPGGQLVFVEPNGHVSPGDFEQSLRHAEAVGFVRTGRQVDGRAMSAVLAKP